MYPLTPTTRCRTLLIFQKRMWINICHPCTKLKNLFCFKNSKTYNSSCEKTVYIDFCWSKKILLKVSLHTTSIQAFWFDFYKLDTLYKFFHSFFSLSVIVGARIYCSLNPDVKHYWTRNLRMTRQQQKSWLKNAFIALR